MADRTPVRYTANHSVPAAAFVPVRAVMTRFVACLRLNE
jgi:hypothetical protein